MGGKFIKTESTPKTRKELFQAGFERWVKDGKRGVFAGFGDPLSKKNREDFKDKPEKEDPPLPPTDGGTITPASGKPKSNSWPDIIAFNFPEGARKQYKDGGLVRGCGAATKGRGRGRIV